MKATYIDYSQTHSFSPAVISYLRQDEKLKPFISHPPTLEGFSQLLENKKAQTNRELLVKIIREQYSHIFQKAENLQHVAGTADLPIPYDTDPVIDNIELLALDNTFTVTTGHQLNIFTGPLYFIYKIVTAINLARDLKIRFPDKHFVPVYWMATEDHDFAEINHTHIGGKKISWEQGASGATGRLDTKDITSALKEYTGVLGASPTAAELAAIVETAYTAHHTLADATRYLVNELFAEYGLVIVDADHAELKRQFAGIMERDIISQDSYKNILSANEKLASIGIEAQVSPREINFFYLTDNLRERLVFENDRYAVLNTDISFSEVELSKEIHEHPERFSPNVVMRPLYQEVILPNIAYIGGGAEVVYWLQLKENFDHYGVEFPILILRNSALITNGNLGVWLGRLNLNIADIFRDPEELKKEWVIKHSQHSLSLTDEWKELSCIFEKIKLRAYKIDPTLAPSTEAVKVRLHKAVESLEKKLIKAEKRNHADSLSRITTIKNKFFPRGGLQERSENFGLFYVKHGRQLISSMIQYFKPLDFKFTILEESNNKTNHS